MPRYTKIALALAPVALLAACGGGSEEPATDETATEATVAVAAPVTYDCLPAQRLSASYDNSGDVSKATLTLDGATYELAAVPAASGVKYVTDAGRSAGKSLVWWTQGEEGTLYEGTAGAPDAAETQIASCSPSQTPAA